MIKIKYKKYKITISNKVIATIINHRQINNKYEAGGMLIGSIVVNSNEIEINDYTEPLKEDSRNRLAFKRSNIHNELLHKKWKDSNFTKLYLGEWHTHPQNIPTPSFIDKISWNKLLVKSDTESDILIFIIGGISSVEIWIGDRNTKIIKRGESYKY